MDIYQKNMDCLNGNDPFTPNLNKECNFGTYNQSNEAISDYYDGAVILVTGGTGFVGKALLEKLLRSCAGIETIYVLMRPKRGLSVEQRYKELLKNQVFDRIRARWPERLGKLFPITGDVSAPNLGVSAEQRELLSTVTTVFHSAATVKFTEPLQAATALNVQGTAYLLKLASDMPLLKALVHVSTAYSNAPRSHIEERVYPPPYDPDSIVRCTKMLPPDTVDTIAETLQGEHPNPYTLTKALAESIVFSHTNLPVCIIRPSIVTAAYQEPFPGWIDNVYGVTGIIMEISRGTYRSGYCRERYVVDLVPVDLVVNSCILAAWRQGCKQPGRCPVYNVTSGSINPLQWGQFTRLCIKWARENPTKYVMWYPNFSFTESRFMNTFWEISCHFLPAFLYDVLLRAQGRKAIMMKLARRFKMAAATGEYFANHEWQFGISELTALHSEANCASDSSAFPHWPAQFNWDAYIGAYMLGIRRFILKDSVESLPNARSKLKRLYWVHRMFQAATGYYVFRFLAGRLR
ncbi:PREDICTED: fatty acyl-CoA reductase 1-like [Papilio xuthus]|uniref:Fatty acyl-CoA reductase n=1 Tax=Papilio xuthus TaxID=66420 RepID=A0AAJ6ZNL2_PAPXU|nr:PREDICTED: fatty acyl-CoA reductase 1-like [Papilio xuthus]XP_013176199.1 PREDICTED: fatty acyl-CoA reductase 1-like [Papilio xuthus]